MLQLMIRPFRRLPYHCAWIAPRVLCHALLLGALCALPATAQATDLPAGVKNYLRQKDPQVKIRFDGLITFSNGESYLPVIPQDAGAGTEAMQVIHTLPAESSNPDVVQFDNGYFLLRLVRTDKNRLTFPKMEEYPLELREGLLPQDLVLPANLFIPVELKVILGALPYNPQLETPPKPPVVPVATGKKPPVVTPPSKGMAIVMPEASPAFPLVVYDIQDHKLVNLDPVTYRKLADLDLRTVPSRFKSSPDGKLLFVTGLTTDELLVVDVGANLVKTRVAVGSKPEDFLFVNNGQQVVVSHRFSDFVSVINTQELVGTRRLPLPGSGGVMAIDPAQAAAANTLVFVADAFAAKVYALDLAKQAVEKQFNVLSNISALWVAPGGKEFWLASRTKHQVQVVDVASGQVLKTFDVGKKPVDFAVQDDALFVVSANGDRLDVIDWRKKTALEPIALPEGSFPSAIAVTAGGDEALVAAAGQNNLYRVSLRDRQLLGSTSIGFKASSLATIQLSKVMQGLETVEAAPDSPVAAPGSSTGPQKASEPTAPDVGTAGKADSKKPRKPLFGLKSKPSRKDATADKMPEATDKPVSVTPPGMEENVLK